MENLWVVSMHMNYTFDYTLNLKWSESPCGQKYHSKTHYSKEVFFGVISWFHQVFHGLTTIHPRRHNADVISQALADAVDLENIRVSHLTLGNYLAPRSLQREKDKWFGV